MAETIVQLADRLSNYWSPRTKIIQSDRKLRDLDPAESLLRDTQITKRMIKVVDGLPQDYWDYTVASLANNPMRFRVPRTRGLEDQKAEHLEKFCYGVDEQVNENLMRRGLEPWRYLLAEQVCGGWYSFFPNAEPLKGGGWLFTMEFWDPMTVFQEWDNQGLTAVVRRYETTLGDIRSHIEGMNEVPRKSLDGDATKTVKVVDAWVKRDGAVLNSLSVDNDVQLDEMDQSEFWDDIPVITGAVNGRGGESGIGGLSSKQKEQMGRSILAPMRRTLQQSNTWRTLHRERARRLMFADIKDVSADGQGIVEPEDLELGQSNIWHLRQGEDVQEVQRSSAQVDIAVEMQRDDIALERSSIPSSLFGVNRPEFNSGLLEQSLSQKATMRLNRYTQVYIDAAERGLMLIARKFRKLNGSATMGGRNLQKRGMDGYFQEEFKARDIPEYFSIRVWHKTATTVDKAAQLDMAMRAAEGGIWTKRRAMEETEVEDPYAEMILLLEEQASLQANATGAIAAMHFEKLAAEFESAGEPEMAESYRMQARIIREQAARQALEAQQGRNASQPNQRTNGFSPSTLSNEATGRNTDLFPPGGIPAAPPRGPSQARFGNTNGAGGLR